MHRPASESRIAGKRHEAIASVLRGRIVDGLWGARERLPSLDSLAEEFSVSNITIRQALARLEQDGLVSRRQGSGTFVNAVDGSRRNLLMQFATCWGPVVETTGPVELRMLQSEVRPESTLMGADADGALPATAYRHLRRISSHQGKTFSMLEAEIDLRIYRRAPKAFETQRAILAVLDGMADLQVSQARQYLTIEVADLEQASLLGVPLGAPIGRIKRIIVDQGGVAIAVVVITYPGAMVKLEMSLSGTSG